MATRRYEICPACGASDQTTGMYCHECGAAVTYDDPDADRRDRFVTSVRSSVSYAFHALLAAALLICLVLILLFFWGNHAKGSPIVLTGMGAALEGEELILPVHGTTIALPAPQCRGPLLFSFRYFMSPPSCSLVVAVSADDGSALHRSSLPASFLTGVARYRIPIAEFPFPPPYTLEILQDTKPVARVRLDVAKGR